MNVRSPSLRSAMSVTAPSGVISWTRTWSRSALMSIWTASLDCRHVGSSCLDSLRLLRLSRLWIWLVSPLACDVRSSPNVVPAILSRLRSAGGGYSVLSVRL